MDIEQLEKSWYYKELQKLSIDGEFSIKCKFISPKGKTKWMDLNADSIDALRWFLNKLIRF